MRGERKNEILTVSFNGLKMFFKRNNCPFLISANEWAERKNKLNT